MRMLLIAMLLIAILLLFWKIKEHLDSIIIFKFHYSLVKELKYLVKEKFNIKLSAVGY